MLMQTYPVMKYEPCTLSKMDWTQTLPLNEPLLNVFETGKLNHQHFLNSKMSMIHQQASL